MIDNTAEATKIIRRAGFPTVMMTLGVRTNKVIIDGYDFNEVKRAAEFMASGRPEGYILVEPTTDSDGIT